MSRMGNAVISGEIYFWGGLVFGGNLGSDMCIFLSKKKALICFCFEHISLNYSKGSETSSGNLLVPLRERIAMKGLAWTVYPCEKLSTGVKVYPKTLVLTVTVTHIEVQHTPRKITLILFHKLK